MLAVARHDERAEQLFTRDLKFFINNQLNPSTRALGMAVEAQMGHAADTFDDVDAVFDRLLDHETFRAWLAMRRTQQEMMWDVVGQSVDRQLVQLESRAAIASPLGSLTLDPDFVAPAYLEHMDTHLMPGGMTVDEGEGTIRQGAIMDAGGAIYQPAAATGVRKFAVKSRLAGYLARYYPDVEPRRILDMGCGVGRTSTDVAQAFPEAEVYAVDVGPSVLRYAHARAENLGVKVHFSQQNAESTSFEDGFFDVVVSTAMFHETSEPAIPKIVNEIHRVLRPGGVTVNNEVPHRYFDEDILGKLVSEWEAHFNNESAYKAAISADYGALFDRAGFRDHRVGWQAMDPQAAADLTPTKPAAGFALYMASARK
jgi:2-polyprenyl-3-methyl-5-hydroxy-6-metoxy-1,4-benzoquinol methylase